MPSEDVAATQALIGGDPFEKEVMHARDQRSRRLENAWNATIILATFALTAAAVTDSFSPRGLRASSSSTAEELSVDHSKEYSITLEGSYNADYPDSTKPTGYDAVVKDAKMIVEPHYDYKLKVVGTVRRRTYAPHVFHRCYYSPPTHSFSLRTSTYDYYSTFLTIATSRARTSQEEESGTTRRDWRRRRGGAHAARRKRSRPSPTKL
jgi:hypothetical protein